MLRLNSAEPGFSDDLNALVRQEQARDENVAKAAASILAEVKAEGDAAVMRYSKQFDGLEANGIEALKVDESQIKAAYNHCPKKVVDAIQLSAKRIQNYHAKQLPENQRYEDEVGVTLGWQWTAVDRAGLYVPGGKASYPSSVLMNAIPALVAGVSSLAMMVPAPNGELNPAVLVAANEIGISEIYTIGGVQAIGALAYGTDSIAPVDVIAGPGNAYVAEAKRQLYGMVGIDMVAGPSEILVIADNQNSPEWIAADLLSQAEHDADARSILLTDDDAFADAVIAAVQQTLETLPREKIAETSWQDNGLVITVRDWQEACAISNALAPEHLEVAVKDPDALLPQLKHAGAIFLGRYTPEAIGDYVAGPSHVLPTSGNARFASGISVFTFLKRSSLIGCSPESFANLADATADFADAEGLDAHALSVRIRGQ